ncbi:MAG: hypothetical protein ACC669_02915 [bacterium]
MGKKDLKDTFIDLEEAVDKLLDNRKVFPGGSRLKSTASGKSASVIDKEAVELIRKAIKRLRALY